MESTTDLASLKQQIRKQAHANRNNQLDKEELSRDICRRFASLPEYEASLSVMLYVHVRSEVRTQEFLPTAISQGKKVIVPYCVDDQLELFLLESMDELSIGTYGILEPRLELRALPEKRIDVERVDLVMVPGVAFDRSGGRMGHGKGYYDRLLRNARPDARLVALAFECQLFPEIPMSPHDIWMDKIVTEKAVYAGRGRA